MRIIPPTSQPLLLDAAAHPGKINRAIFIIRTKERKKKDGAPKDACHFFRSLSMGRLEVGRATTRDYDHDMRTHSLRIWAK